MIHKVYKITNLINDYIYIGVTKDTLKNRLKQHSKADSKIGKAIREFGKENFKIEEIHSFETKDESYAKEKEIVNETFLKRVDVYNAKPGGYGGIGYSSSQVVVRDKNNRTFVIDKSDQRYLSGELEHYAKNKLNVKDVNGNIFSVSKFDERYISGELLPQHKDKCTVKDKDGYIFQVDNTDIRYLSGELVGATKGKCAVKDEIGNIIFVDIESKKYKAGEYKSINLGHMTVKNKTGDTMYMSISDERYLSGEWMPINKGLVVVRDKNNKTFSVDINDERYLSGELVPANKGNKHSTMSKEKMKAAAKDRMWICNKILKKNKLIKKINFPDFEKLGWIKGRNS